MAVRELIVFKHSKELGDCPHINCLMRLRSRKNEDVIYPRQYKDYSVAIHEELVPDSVEISRKI